MRVELGSEVRTTDGQVVGKIKHLIMEPETVNVRAVVIEKGLLLPDDVEVRLDRLSYGVDQRIELNCTKDEYDRLPRFDRSKYTDRPPANLVLAGFPPVGVLWNTSATYPVTATGVGAYAPDGEAPLSGEPADASEPEPEHAAPVVIEKGSSVFSSDDHQLGEVQEVTFDVSTGRPILLVVRSGLIVHTDTQIPAELIQEVTDGEVRLDLTLDHYKQQYAHPLHPAA